ncbi:MAG: hypothetical protein LBU73_08025 [Helicobacteraceae bacterium]|jgi:hypothetical protein|nr:hypothetical protein [Helicobacteraceae bacterium]
MRREFWRVLRDEEDGDEGSGAGGGKTPDAGEPPADKTPARGEPTEPQDEKISVSKREYEEARDYVNYLRVRENTQVEIAKIKQEMSDFNTDEVVRHLSELQKSNPNKYVSLDNPLGWRLIWREIQAKNRPDYNYEPPKERGESEKKELLERAKNGDFLARVKLAEEELSRR